MDRILSGRLIAFYHAVSGARSGLLQRRNRILVGTGNSQLLHPEVKRRPLDSQPCGGPVGPSHNPPRVLQGLANLPSPRPFQRNPLPTFSSDSTPPSPTHSLH